MLFFSIKGNIKKRQNNEIIIASFRKIMENRILAGLTFRNDPGEPGSHTTLNSVTNWGRSSSFSAIHHKLEEERIWKNPCDSVLALHTPSQEEDNDVLRLTQNLSFSYSVSCPSILKVLKVSGRKWHMRADKRWVVIPSCDISIHKNRKI